jgi:hypothetical protein
MEHGCCSDFRTTGTGVIVNKLIVICLTALLAMSISFAGHTEAKVLFDQRPASVAVSSPGAVSSSQLSNALNENSFPTAPDKMILALPFDRAQEAWTQVNERQRQI